MWDQVSVKNLHELLAKFPIKVPQPRNGAVVNNTTLFLQVHRSNHAMENYFCNILLPSLRWSGENACTWDSWTIYDDLEHSIFEKCLHVGPNRILWRLGTLFQNSVYMLDQSWFLTLLTWRKCLHVGPWKILWRLGTLYFRKMLTCGTQLNFMMTWNTLF
jgi:hypothetical protein